MSYLSEDQIEERIKGAAYILLEEYKKTGDSDSIIKNRDQVLSRYGKVFSQSNISNLSWDDFRGFLDFKNNKHWKAIDLQAKLRGLKTNFEAIKKALEQLVDMSQKIEQRIDDVFKIKGIKKATVTPILLVTYPNLYGVWNEISEWCLKVLGVWLITYNNPSKEKLSQGTVYKYVNEVLLKLSKEMSVDLWKLDAIFWYFYNRHKREVPLLLQVNEQYSREDLSNIFSPEFEFVLNGGKWDRTGVVTVDLGARKDFFLFSTKEKFSNWKNPEVIYDDGTFDWVAQQRMNIENNNLSKKLQENNPEVRRILLFIKEKETKPKFTYYGPLEYLSEYKDDRDNKRLVFKLSSWDVIPNLQLRNQIIQDIKPDINAELVEESQPSFNSPNQQNINNGNRPARIIRNYDDIENKKLGDAGEELVLRNERKKLKNYTKLLDKIDHISKKNDSAGFDILSYTENGDELYIEVKTTRGGKETPFYLSANEYKTWETNISKYVIYRLYQYNPSSGAKLYKLSGDLEQYKPKAYIYIFSPSRI